MDIILLEIILLPVVVLMVFGAKSTWKIAENLISSATGLDSFIFIIIIFVIIFIIAAPIMGIINIIKLIAKKKKDDVA